MKRRVFSLLILSSLLIAFTAMTAFSAESPVESRVTKPLVNKSLQYAFPGQRSTELGVARAASKAALGSAIPMEPLGPWGALVGTTCWDNQRNGSMRRMIAWGTHGMPETMLVHFTWMYTPQCYPFLYRKDYYKVWNSAAGMYECEVGIQPDEEYAGFPVIDVTHDNRAIDVNHNNLAPGIGGVYQTQAYWDFGPGFCFFAATCRVPDGLGDWCEYEYNPGEDGFIWPAACWQEGVDTILHVFAKENNHSTDYPAPFPAAGSNQPQALMYFHTVSPEQPPCSWTAEYCVDTVYVFAHDCDCTDEGKVALAWIANVPGECDTCSSTGFVRFPECDNDVYYQISLNGGLTWQPRVNVTKNVYGEDGFRPYTDLSVLIDSKNDMHVVWNTRKWVAGDPDPCRFRGGRLFHYSEDNPFIRTVYDYNWEQITCDGGAWNLNAAKMTVSECDGKLYVIFVQYNDIPAGIFDDCAAPSNPSYPTGAANGELYLTISDDYGLTWDAARNLTNTRTINSDNQYCDSVGGVYGPCPSEVYPSMVKFGTDYFGTFPGNILVPVGSTDPMNYYLDVQYINDHSAGCALQNEGYAVMADVKWFRIPCVEPIPNPYLIPGPLYIDFPSWSKHGVQHDTALTLTNIGNATLIYTLTTEEDTGPPGWLTTSGFSGTIPCGVNNTETGTVHINTGGIVNNPSTIVHLKGRLRFDGNFPTSPCFIPIDHWVTDTLIEPIWDTISTTCTKLTVANNGNFGNNGKGGVNMDYTDIGGDVCPGPGVDVYLYDGSPVVGYPKDGDTLVNYSIFNTTYVDDEGFVPDGDHTPTTDMGEYEVFESGKFVTHDSLLAIEKVWYAPKAPVDSCSFVIECIKVYVNYPYTNETVTGVRIGEAIDWDIPSDNNDDNSSGFNFPRNLIYQQGIETDFLPPPECHNDHRWGGIDFLESYKNGSVYNTSQHGAYTADNATYVFPNSGFVPTELYSQMDNSGYELYCSTNPDSEFVDLHTVMTFDTGLTITVADTFVYYISIVSHYDGTLADFLAEVDEQIQWYEDHINPSPGCCNTDGIRGDWNYDGQLNIADLTYKVDYLFLGGPPPPCFEEADDDCSGALNVADLTYEVDYLFRGGPPPCRCDCSDCSH